MLPINQKKNRPSYIVANCRFSVHSKVDSSKAVLAEIAAVSDQTQPCVQFPLKTNGSKTFLFASAGCLVAVVAWVGRRRRRALMVRRCNHRHRRSHSDDTRTGAENVQTRLSHRQQKTLLFLQASVIPSHQLVSGHSLNQSK